MKHIVGPSVAVKVGHCCLAIALVANWTDIAARDHYVVVPFLVEARAMVCVQQQPYFIYL